MLYYINQKVNMKLQYNQCIKSMYLWNNSALSVLDFYGETVNIPSNLVGTDNYNTAVSDTEKTSLYEPT
jgi:hypothetical protein